MLINFARKCVGTVVTSDKVSADGYECTNLISDSWHTRKQGFVAEHFIKPPVNLTFQFPCSVHIYQVFVTPYVGQQLCSRLEIFSAARPAVRVRVNHSSAQSSASRCGQSAAPTQDNSKPCFSSSQSCDAAKASPPPIFHHVSRISTPDYGRVCFTNPNFPSPSAPSAVTKDANSCPYKNTMQHFKRETLAASSQLCVRLVFTKHGSAVAVSNIDIWGIPAISVSPAVRSDVMVKYTDFITPKPPIQDRNKHIAPAKDKKPDSTHFLKKVDTEELEIPEEFVDPLTCEVMSIPMLLPCGKNIDLSSLDKFLNSEASHGRLPRDPFTGVIFSKDSKAIPNIALKSRIDQFLFKHSNSKATSSIARTVKSKSATPLLGKRDVNGQRLQGGISSLVRPSTAEGRPNSIPPPVGACVNKPQGSCENALVNSNLTMQANAEQTLNSQSSNTSSTIPNILTAQPNTSIKSNSDPEPKSHEHKLRDSLSSALSSLLGVSHSSTPPSMTVTLRETCAVPFKCSSCKEPLSKTSVVYSSPCNHPICRQCLVTTHQTSSLIIKCSSCGTQCNRKDFLRKHQV